MKILQANLSYLLLHLLLTAVQVHQAVSASHEEDNSKQQKQVQRQLKSTKSGRSSSDLMRLECPAPTRTFETFLAVALDNDNDYYFDRNALAHQLADAHREGTATVCDAHQRALTSTEFTRQATTEEDDLTLVLYRVQVQSKGPGMMDPCATAPPTRSQQHSNINSNNFLAQAQHSYSHHPACSIHDILDNTAQDDDNLHEICPRFGCYCPVNAEPSNGLTEAKLLHILQHPTPSGKGKGKGKGKRRALQEQENTSEQQHPHRQLQKQSRFLGKKGTKSTKSSSSVVDVRELQHQACPGRQIARNEYFFGLSQNFCDALTQRQAREFAARFTHAFNLFSFSNCDPLFRRFDQLTPPQCTNDNNNDNRQLFYSSSAWETQTSSTFGGGFISPEQPGLGWYRKRRHLQEKAEDSPQQSLMASASSASPDPEVVQSMRRLIDQSKAYRQSNIDYGTLNQGDNCYCDHHFTGTPRGITEPEFNELARQIMVDVTGGNLEVLNSAEVEAQTCGSPAVFTQTLNVIANGDESAVQEGLAELLGKVLNRLSLTRCVANYFQILDVNLVYQAEEVSTKVHPPETAWALQFEVQYVAFGASGKAADLFWSECPLQKHMPSSGKRHLATATTTNNNYQFSTQLEPAGPSQWLGNIDRDDIAASVAKLQTAQDAGRALFPIDARQLESAVVGTTCVCDVNKEHPLDQLPLSLVNHELDRVVCDDAVPGVTFAVIVC